MAKTAVMVRLSEGELCALDAMALKSGISRATCATSILRQRLGGQVIAVDRPTPSSSTARTTDHIKCSHDAIYRTVAGRCIVCER